MSTELSVIEHVLVQGDLVKLSPPQRVEYYNRVCESLNLNPLTRPFHYLQLNGKLQLYATKDCAEQLRKRDGISISIVSREVVEEVYVVTARAVDPNGRCDESIGAVPLGNLKGDARANAIMKAETKAKRRVTLSFAGLGMLDETETSSIPSAYEVKVNAHGEIENTSEAVSTRPQLQAPAEQRQPRAAKDLAECQSCGATIAWAKTPNGKNAPFDVINGIRTDVIHFQTCPNADDHRKPKTGTVTPVDDAPPVDATRVKYIARIRELLREVGTPDELTINLDEYSMDGLTEFGAVLRMRHDEKIERAAQVKSVSAFDAVDILVSNPAA
ncbi:hypothetical protein [Herpetosiphon geysericola]|uniref:hypothetical protein n=1 Tax=Herpetosiphon geysericola TaxID=70996 RepID=UPI0006C93290|nr:hypothetical protein [Herpetosiphon geysericola]